MMRPSLRSLSAKDVLELAEDGEETGSASRALAILARAVPSRDPDQLRALAVGRRDAELMDIRALTFGRTLLLVSRCPHCGMLTDLDLTADRIGLTCAAVPEDWEARAFSIGAETCRLRPVTAGDLADLEHVGDATELGRHLLRRCLTPAEAIDNAEVECRLDAWIALDSDHLASLEAALVDLDPAADTLLELMCPACRNLWTEAFDAPAIVWRELRAEAGRLLGEIAELARTYHWAETDILALPPVRRRFYLEAARA